MKENIHVLKAEASESTSTSTDDLVDSFRLVKDLEVKAKSFREDTKRKMIEDVLDCINQYVDLAIRGDIELDKVEAILKENGKKIDFVTMLSVPMENDIVYGVKEVIDVIESLVKIRQISKSDLDDIDH